MSPCFTRAMTLRRPILHRALPALLALLLAVPAQAEIMIGRVSVVDGDTLDMHGQRIRLFGIDAPEGGQSCQTAEGKVWRCGTAAARAMDDLVRDRTVSCDPQDIDRYGRTVAICEAGGSDIASALVGQGLAVAYRKYSKAYVAAENEAHAANRGMWAGEFLMPSDWRKAHKPSP